MNADRGPTGLGQYHGLWEYCSPHTASSVFLILIPLLNITIVIIIMLLLTIGNHF